MSKYLYFSVGDSFESNQPIQDYEWPVESNRFLAGDVRYLKFTGWQVLRYGQSQSQSHFTSGVLLPINSSWRQPLETHDQ
jgi:hypothetical protein